MTRNPVNPDLISSTLINLLDYMGIRTPFASEIVKKFVEQWVDNSPNSDLEKYLKAIRVAKRSGNNLRKTLNRLLETADEEDKRVISALFISFLLASLFHPSEVIRTE